MLRKTVSGIMLTILSIGMLTLAFNVRLVEAGTITVPDDYPTIQEAINAANPGDTIIVSVGLYAEGQINVNKSLSLLADGALVDGLRKGHVFYVTASYVTIEGFTVKKSKRDNWPMTHTYAGIKLRNVQNCTVSGNIIKDTGHGVWLSLSNNNTVDGNTISSASNGVYLSESGNNQVTNNTLFSLDGICLSKSNDNIISDNTIRSSLGNYGVSLSKSTNNTITTNTIRSYVYGVSLSSGNKFINNSVKDCFTGVSVGSNNTITANDCKPILYGLANIVSVSGSNNTITANDLGGVKLTGINNKFRDNNMTYFSVATTKLSFINDVDASNTLDGKPIYYWINKHDMTVPTDAGYVALFNCTGIIIQNLTLRPRIVLVGTSNSTIKNNNIRTGIRLYVSSHNAIYHNNFAKNTEHVSSEGSTNIWDNGYPSGGNYWSGYELHDQCNGPDQDQPGSDGIGDIQYRIDMFNEDRFPLMRPIKFFDAGIWNEVNYYVDITSTSTVSNFQLNAPVKTISFNVAGSGFCRVTIPNIIVQDLWQGNYTVLVDGEPPLDIRNWTTTENTYIYFTYQSEHEVVIVPEFPSAIITPLFMIISMLAVALAKRKPKMRK